MAQTTTISRNELARVAALAYEGQTLKVMLCEVGTSGFTAESSVADWQSVELTGNGYVRFSAQIQTGAWSNTAAAHVMPDIDASFVATGVGYTYDRVVLYIDGETNIHSLITENPNIALLPGQTQTYRISLRQDD